MPKQPTDFLLQLIKSLTKPEKRHFKLFVQRNPSNSDSLFLRLFSLLEKQKLYDEALIMKQVPEIKKQQLPNLKAHLYKQLLLSLRLMHRQDNVDIDLRERIDYARILYNKGLYRQSLELLDKSKAKCHEYNLHSIHVEILEFEKIIESQYITRSIETRAEQLSLETNQLTGLIQRIHLFSNLSLQLYGLYLKVGYVRNAKDHFFTKEFFQSHLPIYREQDLEFYEKLYLFQSYVWYNHMQQDFKMYYKYSQKWVQLYEANPVLMDIDRPIYLKGLHNLLNALFLVARHDKFTEALASLERFSQQSKPRNENEESLEFLYLNTHRINLHYMEGTFQQGLVLVPPIINAIKNDLYHLDYHRVILFYYKIACLYFGAGDNSRSIDYLNLIVNESPDIRGDIQCFARILRLIAYYEMGDNYLIEYQVKSIYRFLNKMEDLHAVQKEILNFIRRIPRIRLNDMKREFIKLRDQLIKYQDDPYEKRSFLYLDIIAWLDSKINGVLIQQIVQEKFLRKNNY